MRNIAIALVIGCLATLIICYTYSIAASINDRHSEMTAKLIQLGDASYEGPEDSGSTFLLFAIGAIFTVFTGGIVATLLSKTDGLPLAERLDSSVIAAIVPVLAICAMTLINWNISIQGRIDQYGRLYEPAPFIMVIFILVVYSAVMFATSAAGGALVALSKKNRN